MGEGVPEAARAAAAAAEHLSGGSEWVLWVVNGATTSALGFVALWWRADQKDAAAREAKMSELHAAALAKRDEQHAAEREKLNTALKEANAERMRDLRETLTASNLAITASKDSHGALAHLVQGLKDQFDRIERRLGGQK